MRRWLGATGVRIPQIAVAGEDLELLDDAHVRVAGDVFDALIVGPALDKRQLAEAHERGLPVLVRAESADDVVAALRQPEVAAAVVPAEAAGLRNLDLVELTYG